MQPNDDEFEARWVHNLHSGQFGWEEEIIVDPDDLKVRKRKIQKREPDMRSAKRPRMSFNNLTMTQLTQDEKTLTAVSVKMVTPTKRLSNPIVNKEPKFDDGLGIMKRNPISTLRHITSDGHEQKKGEGNLKDQDPHAAIPCNQIENDEERKPHLRIAMEDTSEVFTKNSKDERESFGDAIDISLALKSAEASEDNSEDVISEESKIKAQLTLDLESVFGWKSNFLEKENEGHNNILPVMGFQTASGSKMKIPNGVLSKAKSIFGDEDVQDIIHSEETNEINRKNIAYISIKGSTDLGGAPLGEAKNKFQESVEEFKPLRPKENISGKGESCLGKLQMCKGFMTARGSEVNISDVAMEKAKTVFEGCEDEDSSENVRQRTEKLHESEVRIQPFAGFKTAAGFKVPASKGLSSKVKIIFGDEDFSDVAAVQNSPSIAARGSNIDLRSTIAKPNGCKNDSLIKIQTLSNAAFLPNGVGTNAKFTPNVSKGVPSGVKKIFGDEDFSDLNWHGGSGGFKTAAGIEVDVCGDSLKMLKNLSKESDVHVGFKTATRQQARTTESAKNKPSYNPRQIFGDEDFSDIFSSAKSFHARVGIHAKPSPNVTNSVESNAKNIFGNEDFSDLNCGNISGGFKTAVGIKVDISDDSLKKGENMFKECGDHGGFQTEAGTKAGAKSGTKEKVSKLPVTRSTHVFGEDFSDIFSFPNDEALKLSGGFKTASGAIMKTHRALPGTNIRIETTNPIKCSTIDGKKTISRQGEVLESCDDDDGFICDTQVLKEVENIAKEEAIITSPSSRKHLSGETSDGFFLEAKKVNNCVKQECCKPKKFQREAQKMLIEKRKRGRAKPSKGRFSKAKESPYKITLAEVAKLEGGCNDSAENVTNQDVVAIDESNSVNYRFRGEMFFSSAALSGNEELFIGDGASIILADDNKLGVEEFELGFLTIPSVQPSLVPDGWVRNHYRWIVWTLAALERRFPTQFGGKCLRPAEVMMKLKMRYDREIDGGERSAIKKIYEGDANPSSCLVLCVACIATSSNHVAMELMDGWYSIPVLLSPGSPLVKHISNGKIKPGTKLITVGAELSNMEQPASPLEVQSFANIAEAMKSPEFKDSQFPSLKLHANSTRIARWDLKMGFRHKTKSLPVKFSSLMSGGGMISEINVAVVRQYPLVYKVGCYTLHINIHIFTLSSPFLESV